MPPGSAYAMAPDHRLRRVPSRHAPGRARWRAV